MKISFFKIVFAFVFFLSPFVVRAGTEHNMSGYAWGSGDNGGVGWISFNSTNTGSIENYGVNKEADGTLVGHAWSPNIGWIQFGGLDTNTMPSGTGTQKQNANINGNNLKGWAKALSADGNGWDGWISLSGAGYGVNFSGNAFSSYAWGSDVVGWVDFSGVIVGAVTLVNGSCGAANGSSYSSAPSSGLCAAGTASSVSGSGPWSWSCVGSGTGHTDASCSASTSGSVVNGLCGIADGSSYSSAPSSGLCAAGTASSVSGSGPWSWSCTGSGSGHTNDSCDASLSVGSVGTCSSPDNHLNRCVSGTPSAISSSPSRWSWTCTGLDASVDQCSENKRPIIIQN